MRALKRECRTEKRPPGGVAFASSPRAGASDFAEPLRAIPEKDHAYYAVAMEIEEARSQRELYQEKANQGEAALLEKQVYTNPEIAELEYETQNLK